MDPFVRGFIRSSLLWLCTGVIIGVAMAFSPRALIIRPAHVHANLLGFVSMMIFGVAYHVIPRFSGAPLHRPRLAALHLWVANIGLSLLVAGWIVRAYVSAGTYLVELGGSISALGAFLFVYNLWRTLDAARPAGAPVLPHKR